MHRDRDVPFVTSSRKGCAYRIQPLRAHAVVISAAGMPLGLVNLEKWLRGVQPAVLAAVERRGVDALPLWTGAELRCLNGSLDLESIGYRFAPFIERLLQRLILASLPSAARAFRTETILRTRASRGNRRTLASICAISPDGSPSSWLAMVTLIVGGMVGYRRRPGRRI